MPDVFTKQKRSWVMSRIRSRNTKPERLMEGLLRETGVRFDRHSVLPGTPDFVIWSAKLAVFVDGDFWHGYRMGPKKLATFSEYWRNKIQRNKRRDRKANKRLKAEGWSVMRVWEHEILREPDKTARRLKAVMKTALSS